VSEKARKLVVEAKKQLDSLPESNARDMLSALADFVIEREF